MSRKLLVLLGVIALAMSVTPAIAATPSADVLAATADLSVERVDRSIDRRALDFDNRPAPDLDAVVQVFIQLTVPSVAEYVATQTTDGGTVSDARQRLQRNAVLAQQAKLRADLAPYIIEERSALQIGANGFRAMVKVRDVAAINATEGVESVAKVTLHTPTNSTSVPWIGADDAWVFTGQTGTDVSVAIIDTGIDYYHANYGGSGDPMDYEDDDPTIIEGGTFPTAKVVGGWDFTGDNYDASGDVGPTTPTPDADPLDCNGHGTHVAGTAAGLGVETDGSTYPGPYDDTTYGTDFKIGPGVAPGADLYALKVFGCDGSTDVTSDAIEWALDPNGDGSISDAVDVINMSLGAPIGSPLDPSAIASNNAVMNGVVVVASAGNEGPASYVTGSPGVAEYAISVAASIDGGVSVGATTINAPGSIAGVIESSEADFSAPLDEVGPLTDDLAFAEPFDACTAITNPDDLDGKIAFVTRGSCRFDLKYTNISATGAVGMVVMNNTGGPPFVMGGDYDSPLIPAVMISQADGITIATEMDGGATVNVTLDSSVVIPKPDLIDSLADFTSSGPAHFDSGFKPDLAAPGFSISSAGVGSGTGASISSGTSMAAPHVAGMAAILRDQRKGLDPSIVKSMLQNSATPAYVAPTNVGTPDEARITLQGAGIAQLDRAVDLKGYTMPAGIAFGRVNPTAATEYTETVWVHSLDDAGITWVIDVTGISTPPGVTVTAPDSVFVPGGGAASFDVTMSLDTAAMDSDDGWFSQTEATGRITLTDEADLESPGPDDDTLNLAYLGVVDPASAVTMGGALGSATFSNFADGDGWAEGFTLAGVGDDVGGAVGAVGVRWNDYGVPVVEFGLAHTAPWNTLMSYEVDIYLDSDQDGTDDYVLVAADLGLLLGGDFDGRTVTGLFNLNTGDFPLEYFVLGDLNDHVQVLTVDAYGSPFGFLEDGDTDFDYTVVVIDLQTGGLAGLQEGSVDLAYAASAADLPLSLGIPAGASGVLPGLDVMDTTGEGSQEMLWLYSNNMVPDQFEIIEVETTTAPYWPADAKLAGSDITETDVTLTWPDAMDKDGEVVGYTVWQDGAELVSLGADKNSYTASGLDDGTLYDFAVTATDDDGFESEALEASFTTMTDYTASTVGAFDPDTATWVLRNSVGDETVFSFGNAGDQPIMGDWTCDGVDTPGVFRNGMVSLRFSNTGGAGEHTFMVGSAGDVAVAGDWNNDGCDSIGLHRPSTGEVFIWDELPDDGAIDPAFDVTYYFGNPSDKAFAGDFDGDGTDTIGLHRESTGLVYFRNSHTQGNADNEFYFGNPDDRLIAGDWGIVDGVDTPAVFRPSQTVWYFRHTNTQGNADSQFTWGEDDWRPVAGAFGLG